MMKQLAQNQDHLKMKNKLNKFNDSLLKFCNFEIDSSPSRHILIENKRRVFFWPDIKSKEMQLRKSVFIDRAKKWQIRKRKMLLEHIKKSKQYLNRWEMLRKKRFEEEKVQKKIDLK